VCNQPVRTVSTTDNIHIIPLLETEDTSEENWGNNILINPRKKKPIYLAPNREILL